MFEVFDDGRPRAPFARVVPLDASEAMRLAAGPGTAVVVDLGLGPLSSWSQTRLLLEKLPSLNSVYYIIRTPLVLLTLWRGSWKRWLEDHRNVSLLVPLVNIPADILLSKFSLYVQIIGISPVSEAQRLSVHANIGVFVEDYNESVLAPLMLNAHTIVMRKGLQRQLSALSEALREEYKFADYVIEPLDTVTRNLDLSIYKQFLDDKQKYVQYEDAISLALLDLGAKYGNLQIDILIIGAGTGALVDILMRHHKLHFTVTIIEKNPLTWPILREKCTGVWENKVTLLEQDARSYRPERRLHLVVSEMLGSFGCNELCPEVIHHIDGELMIPKTHRSSIRPIFTPIVHNKPFLQKLYRYYPLSDSFYFVWEFAYPQSLEPSREVFFDVVISNDGVVNALEGVFQAELYFNGICNYKCDITEQNGSYCKSWYPMIFPITPIKVKKGDTIHVGFERISCHSAVQYAWTVNGMRSDAKLGDL